MQEIFKKSRIQINNFLNKEKNYESLIKSNKEMFEKELINIKNQYLKKEIEKKTEIEKKLEYKDSLKWNNKLLQNDLKSVKIWIRLKQKDLAEFKLFQKSKFKENILKKAILNFNNSDLIQKIDSVKLEKLVSIYYQGKNTFQVRIE